MEIKEAIANIEYARKWLGSESDFSDEALDMAISALEKQEQVVDASCETCKYKNRSGNTYPCFGCFRASDQDDYYEPYTEEKA